MRLPRRALRPLLVALVLLAPACASRTDRAPAPSGAAEPSPASPTAPAGSAGCRAPDAAAYARAGTLQLRSLTVDGTERTYRLYLPAVASPSVPAPLVLNFHGLGSSAAEQEAYSGLLPVAAREGFVLVSPDGEGQPRRWGVPGLPSEESLQPDLRFVDALLAELEDRLCLDPGRIYATGLSNGAFFSSVLGCLRPEAFAAVAPVAGVYFPRVGCRGQVPLLAVHGRLDQVVPYDAGLIFGLIPYAGAEAYAEAWARQNGCEAPPERRSIAPHVTETSWPGCAAETRLLTIEDGGHTWPGSIDVPRLGPTNHEITAADVIWAFFARQERRPPAPR